MAFVVLVASLVDMPGEVNEISSVMGDLAQAINDLRTDRVPPPLTFSGLGGASAVNSFFCAFEKYATSIYKQDLDSWYQVLPSFLDGEAKAIVRAFGRDASYEVVKQRLIVECSNRTSLTSNDFAEFFSASRSFGESLVCFSIRLESLARKVSVASSTGQEVMVKSKFLSSLPHAILEQLNVQLGHKESASLSEVVRLATILESQNVSFSRSRLGKVSAIFEDESPGFFEREVVVCSFCCQSGHVEESCFAKRSSEIACEFCGLGVHSLANCDIFKRRCFACVWCGSIDHQSFMCSQKPNSGN